MRRVALLALAIAACSNPQVEHPSGPLGTFYYPTGLAVLDHRLYVASSNADLSYDSATGGTVISVDPLTDPVPAIGGVNIESFAGELGIADTASCPALATAGKGTTVIVPIRGSNLVYRVDVGASGALTCDGCDLAVGSSERGDPFAVGIACDGASAPGGAKVARAYVGYLRSSVGQAWVTQIDLTREPTDPLYVQHQYWNDAGTAKAFAYDATRRRLYFTRSVTGLPETLRYVDLTFGAPDSADPLGKPCAINAFYVDGGCWSDKTANGAIPAGVELRGIALANDPDPASTTRRAYMTGHIYDPVAAANAGYAAGDYDGLLLVVDLTMSAGGRLQFDIVNQFPIGSGAAYVRVLPPRPGKRDLVAAIAVTDGSLWIYDDETGDRVAFNRDPATGVPLLGDGPFGLVVDPVPLAGNVARLYAGSFRQHWVTPVDVPLDDPHPAESARIPLTSKNEPVRIGGGVLP